MSDDGKKGKRKGGCISRLATLFAFLGLAALAAALYFIAQPQDTSDIEGVGPGAVGKRVRDLKVVLEKSREDGYPVTLSEEEINLYLRETLESKQGGLLADQVSLDEVMVRLEEGKAEVVLVRRVAGRPFTVSLFVQADSYELPDGTIQREISMSGGPYHDTIPRPLIGGRFGRIQVPQGFIRFLTLESFSRLASVYRDPSSKEPALELDLIEDMSRIEIHEGRLELDPRANTRELSLPGGF